MNITEFLKITPESLAKEQHDALKAHAISVLTEVIEVIRSEQYDKINSFTELSSSGDGYGQDNHYIDFGIIDYYDKNGADISQVAEKLMSLKQISGGDKNANGGTSRKQVHG